MKIQPFKLERYFARYEFHARYLLSSSDCDGLALNDVLRYAGEEESGLWNNLRLGYTESQGLPLLREAISKQYTTITPEQVVVLSPGEANYCLMNVLLEKGDHVVCMAPAYQSLYQVADSMGCQLSFWKPDESTWRYDPSVLKGLVTPKTKLLIVNFPHNPTGFLPTRKDMDDIIGIGREHNLVIFSDEMYRELVHDPAKAVPSLSDLYENAVSLWGMAKSFGLAGLRLGWLVSRNEKILDQVVAYKDYLTICNNSMSEILALIAVRHKEKFIGPNVKKILSNLKEFSRFQSKHAEWISFPPPIAGSTLFARLQLTESTLDYCERLVQETGIMLVPSEMFDYGECHVRIGLGREKLPEALAVWDSHIRK